MEIKITNYSCYDNGIVSKTENVCNVIDKMIQLAAKLTERFASDIIYDINNLNDAITLKNTWMIFFSSVRTGLLQGNRINLRQMVTMHFCAVLILFRYGD